MSYFDKIISQMVCVLYLMSNPWTAFAWSNRGHRLINNVAARALPPDMPSFLRKTSSIREISYLGPEPDRWTQRGLQPELTVTTGPDHFIQIEMLQKLKFIPRERYAFSKRLDEMNHAISDRSAKPMTAKEVGTLPWEANEIFERLKAAFHNYRIANGEFPSRAYTELAPLDKKDRSDIEATILFYIGWLGHYIGDGCMPLHTSINIAGWVSAKNPESFSGEKSIHHRLEEKTDELIQEKKLQIEHVQSHLNKVQRLADPFASIVHYLQLENSYVVEVYRLDKQGEFVSNADATTRFVENRMADGAAMLRNLVYTAWLDSAALSPPGQNGDITIVQQIFGKPSH